MTTPELSVQDGDVTRDKMEMQTKEKTKTDSSDKKSDREKKKKKKEHKTRKEEQKEEIESVTEPCVMEDEETPRKKKKEKKKKKAKLSEGIDDDNCKEGHDSGKEKKKKEQKSEDSIGSSLHINKEKKRKRTKHVEGVSQENVHGGGLGSGANNDIGGSSERLVSEESSGKEEIEIETEHCEKKDEEMPRKKKKKTKLSESIDGDYCEGEPDSGKEKKKNKQKSENSVESSLDINKEKKRKKTKYVEGGSQENVHEGGSGSRENEEIGGPSERLVSKGSSRKEEIEIETEPCVNKDEEMPRKKKKKKKAKLSEGIDGDNWEGEPDSGKEKKKKSGDSIENSLHINKEKKRKKTKSVEGGSGSRENEDIGGPSEKLVSPRSSKKVRFSEDVEVFPIVDGESSGKTTKDDGLIRGKRFSKEEDEMVKMAVMNYIEEHALGDEGLQKVLKCREFPELKNCWKDIGQALPWRPYLSVYYRAHILFERDETCKWTPEEYEIVRKFHEKYGSDWKALAEALGKHRFHVKDTWRRIKLPNMKKGPWTQDEYQNLFDLVNTDLRLKVFEEKKSKHGMLRDNICWGAISDKLSTRSTAICCQKWYRQLTSPMVAEDEWADIDDYRLVDALFSLDACSIEDVDWDQLLEHRDGDVCRKRWSQMVKHIGGSFNKSFSEQVEVLSKRYCADVLDAREAYDNAPIVD